MYPRCLFPNLNPLLPHLISMTQTIHPTHCPLMRLKTITLPSTPAYSKKRVVANCCYHDVIHFLSPAFYSAMLTVGTLIMSTSLRFDLQNQYGPLKEWQDLGIFDVELHGSSLLDLCDKNLVTIMSILCI